MEQLLTHVSLGLDCLRYEKQLIVYKINPISQFLSEIQPYRLLLLQCQQSPGLILLQDWVILSSPSLSLLPHWDLIQAPLQHLLQDSRSLPLQWLLLVQHSVNLLNPISFGSLALSQVFLQLQFVLSLRLIPLGADLQLTHLNPGDQPVAIHYSFLPLLQPLISTLPLISALELRLVSQRRLLPVLGHPPQSFQPLRLLIFAVPR